MEETYNRRANHDGEDGKCLHIAYSGVQNSGRQQKANNNAQKRKNEHSSHALGSTGFAFVWPIPEAMGCKSRRPESLIGIGD
jgi:hypothetical protein